MRNPLAFALILATLLCALPAALQAHEPPASAVLNIHVAPRGGTLSVVVRAPLASLGDVDHPRLPSGGVAVSRADKALAEGVATWIVPAINLFEAGNKLPEPRIAKVRMALPSDRNFEDVAKARAGLDAPKLDDSLDLPWSQQFVDALLEYEIGDERSAFAIDLKVDRLANSVTTVLRFVMPDGTVRAYDVRGNQGLIELDPSWTGASRTFLVDGIGHILTGADHLLFLACLVIPLRRLRPLVGIVTAFTLGHSLTLVTTALGYGPTRLWFPPLIEFLIAASILYMALENILHPAAGYRWALALGFGLIHGFGFSFGLSETMQFAGDHLLLSLGAFNVGVEIGQLALLAVFFPAIEWLKRHVADERTLVVVASALAGHTAWHWAQDRWAVLARFPFPRIDDALLIGMMQGAMALLTLAAFIWVSSAKINRWIHK